MTGEVIIFSKHENKEHYACFISCSAFNINRIMLSEYPDFGHMKIVSVGDFGGIRNVKELLFGDWPHVGQYGVLLQWLETVLDCIDIGRDNTERGS